MKKNTQQKLAGHAARKGAPLPGRREQAQRAHDQRDRDSVGILLRQMNAADHHMRYFTLPPLLIPSIHP